MLRRFVLAVLMTGLFSSAYGGTKTIRGSGNLTSESRDVSDFNEVELQGIGNLAIRQTGSESLTIEAEDNIIPYLKSEVEDNHLMLYIESGVGIGPTKPINYKLTVKDLSDLKLIGSGAIDIENIKTNDLKITTSGSGSVSASTDTNSLEVVLSGSGAIDIENIKTSDLKITTSGSGDAKMAGRTDSQAVNISGSGRYQAENLQSREAKVTVSGAGSATLNVNDALEARIAGIGSVEYTGDPTTVIKQISGIGKVRKR